MTMIEWYKFFRMCRNGPIASILKARLIVRGKSVRTAPRWHERTWFEMLVLSYPCAALIGWTVS